MSQEMGGQPDDGFNKLKYAVNGDSYQAER
jgi:hypothetical protein